MRRAKPIVPISPEERDFFQEFYQNYKKTIYLIARKMAHSDPDTEDLSQSIVEHLIAHIPKLMELEPNKIGGYIYATALHAQSDILRKRKGKIIVSFDEEICTDLNRMQWDLVPELSRKMDIQRLQEVLTPREWVVLRGYYILGYSQVEIGRSLGMPPGSVRMLLSRVRRKCRRILKPEELTRGW